MKTRYMKSACSARGAVIIFLATVCMAVGFVDASAAGRKILWQSRDQFVALEHQETLPGVPALPNHHPAEVTPDKLAAILGSMDLRSPDNEKPVPLFTKETIGVLADQLQKGLSQASANEDVTFAVIGLHNSMLGFAKSPKVTTGRVFYQGGNLNIIIGQAHHDFNEREDRRLSPFTPGSRMKTSAGDWSIIPHGEMNTVVQVRKDWAAFNDKWHHAAVGPVTEDKPEPASLQIKPHKQMQSPVERLNVLNELKTKGLITQEEYRAKRQEILDSL